MVQTTVLTVLLLLLLLLLSYPYFAITKYCREGLPTPIPPCACACAV